MRRKKEEVEVISGVYEIQSIINTDRIYIGSSNNINKRWYDHKSLLNNNKHHSRKLQNHVNKYGIKDLTFNILEYTYICNNTTREQYYIDILKPYFNCSRFATRVGNQVKSELTKIKIGNGNKGKVRSECTRKKISDTLSSPILQYSLDGVFLKEYSSSRHISNEFNIGHSHILECCNMKRRSVHGYTYRWKNSDVIENKIFVRDKIHINHPRKVHIKASLTRMKKVMQFNLNGQFIDEFESRKEASLNTGVAGSGISNCCNGKKKQAGGFIWKYKN